MKEQLIDIEVGRIIQAKAQPRKHFNENELKELKDSIAEIGLIHPPVVSLGKEGTYVLISGERRLRACELLGMVSIPVILRDYDDKTAAFGSLVENIQRVDLNPMEVAFGIKNLMDEFSLSQSDVSIKIGKERSTVSNYLRLIQLPLFIQKSLRMNEITMGHAKALLSLTNSFEQQLVLETILREQLSVRETETRVRKLGNLAKGKGISLKQRDFHLEDIERRIQEKLGTKVSIVGNAKKGSITFSYSSLDDIDRILSMLGIEGL